MEDFKKYIRNLPDDDEKTWLLDNIERMPYETNYEFAFADYSQDPEKDYYQGIDRISSYLHGFGGW